MAGKVEKKIEGGGWVVVWGSVCEVLKNGK